MGQLDFPPVWYSCKIEYFLRSRIPEMQFLQPCALFQHRDELSDLRGVAWVLVAQVELRKAVEKWRVPGHVGSCEDDPTQSRVRVVRRGEDERWGRI